MTDRISCRSLLALSLTKGVALNRLSSVPQERIETTRRQIIDCSLRNDLVSPKTTQGTPSIHPSSGTAQEAYTIIKRMSCWKHLFHLIQYLQYLSDGFLSEMSARTLPKKDPFWMTQVYRVDYDYDHEYDSDGYTDGIK